MIARETECLEFVELRPRFDDRHHRGNEIRQVGPFVHNVERARIGEATMLDIAGDHPVKPGAAAAAAKEIAGAQHDYTNCGLA